MHKFANLKNHMAYFIMFDEIYVLLKNTLVQLYNCIVIVWGVNYVGVN